MAADEIRRTKVWSGAVRLVHWVLVLAVLFLVATGWLLGQMLVVHESELAAAHVNTGYVVLAALGVRGYLLLIGRQAERWRAFIPDALGIRAMGAMLRFYLSWGRSPLPAYYAHNPLWAPVYLLFYVVLTLQAATGILSLTAWHGLGYRVISAFVVLHILAAFLHDWKGTGSEVSAMISGYKIFVVRKQTLDMGVQKRILE